MAKKKVDERVIPAKVVAKLKRLAKGLGSTEMQKRIDAAFRADTAEEKRRFQKATGGRRLRSSTALRFPPEAMAELERMRELNRVVFGPQTSRVRLGGRPRSTRTL